MRENHLEDWGYIVSDQLEGILKSQTKEFWKYLTDSKGIVWQGF